MLLPIFFYGRILATTAGSFLPEILQIFFYSALSPCLESHASL